MTIILDPYAVPSAVLITEKKPERNTTVRPTSNFKVGVCCICERSFRPKRVRMETMIYCSRKCCDYTSPLAERKPMGVDGRHDAIIHREWDAIQWAHEEAKKFDDEPLEERLIT